MRFKDNNDSGSARYWDELAEVYQQATRISTEDFHYGPLLPGDSELKLLPKIGPAEFRALEIGCGAGQNSIFLARQGARCVAVDLSEAQLAHGRRLAAAAGVEVDFRCGSMDRLRAGLAGEAAFDLVHSAYALPFAAAPQQVLAEAAALLRPGGTLLLSVGHPLYSGEWLDLGDAEEGVFLPNYFQLEPDVRSAEDGRTLCAARYWPLSQVAEWLHAAGLVMERLLEPAPLPIPHMSEAEIRRRVPYESADWRGLYPQLARVPVVAVFKGRKAGADASN
jgi:SAM-dependent methyltransferase